MTGYNTGLLTSLAKREIIIPYVERAFFDDRWSGESYTIEVDTSPHGAGTDGYFHPSTHAMSTDDRWLYHQIHPELSKLNVPERPSLGLAMAAAVGTSIHAVIQQKLKTIGLVTDDEIEVDAIDEDNHWRGKIDLMIQGRLVDIKTCTSGAFDYTQKPRDYWLAQVRPYMDFMEVDRCVILLAEVGYPYRMKELTVHQDRDHLNEIYTRWRRVYDMVHNGDPAPKFCCSLGSDKMKQCVSRAICWGGD